MTVQMYPVGCPNAQGPHVRHIRTKNERKTIKLLTKCEMAFNVLMEVNVCYIIYASLVGVISCPCLLIRKTVRL